MQLHNGGRADQNVAGLDEFGRLEGEAADVDPHAPSARQEEDGEDEDADLFIVCPTVDMGEGGNYNADISTEKMKSKFVGALNMELGIYSDTAAVYSP